MANFNIDYLVVAGGGGGGGSVAGGGGAGGLLTNYGSGSAISLNTGTNYSITVGAGGSGGPTMTQGTDGSNSSISGTGITTITSTGGGAGGTSTSAGSNTVGRNGGSGGGGSWYINSSGAGKFGGSEIAGQGFGGGYASGAPSSLSTGGGGGGAGAVGGNGIENNRGGLGGSGLQNSITGTSPAPYYAGGGGGGGGVNTAAGGTGGGGIGSTGTTNGGSGTNGLGGGGGGSFNYSGGSGGDGGDGVVILRYTTSDIDSYNATGLTLVETIVGTDTVLSFTTVGTGTITFTALPPPPFNPTKVTNPVTGFNSATEDGLKLPSGTNANQPTGAEGMIRNNTSQNTGGSVTAIEHHNGTTWKYFAATESAVVDPTLVLYLNANDPASGISSTSWVDISANNYALTSNGTPVLTGTSPQKEYDIASGDYFGLPNTAPPFGATNGVISVECWVKLNTNTSRAYFFSTSSTTNSNDYFYIGWLSDLGNVYVAYRNGTTSDQYFELGALSGNTSWQHIFCQLNGTTKEIWINGIQQSTTSTGTGSSSGWVDYVSYATSTSTNIGILRKTSIGYGDANYGQIRYWNNSKTQAEIIAFFNERATDFGKTPIT